MRLLGRSRQIGIVWVISVARLFGQYSQSPLALINPKVMPVCPGFDS